MYEFPDLTHVLVSCGDLGRLFYHVFLPPLCRELDCHACVCFTSSDGTYIWYLEKGDGKGSYLNLLDMLETNNLCMLYCSYQ